MPKLRKPGYQLTTYNAARQAGRRLKKILEDLAGANRTERNTKNAYNSRLALSKIREVDELIANECPGDKTQERLPVATALTLSGLSARAIDELCSWPPGTTAFTKNTQPEAWKIATQRHIDAVVDEFYRSRISLLEHLVTAAPYSIELLDKIQRDEERSPTERMRAAGQLKDWIALFFKTDSSKAARDLLPPEMKNTAEEALDLQRQLSECCTEVIENLEN